jgi:hypothetical protein
LLEWIERFLFSCSSSFAAGLFLHLLEFRARADAQ